MMLMWRCVAAMMVAIVLLGGCTGAATPSTAPDSASTGQLGAPTPPLTPPPTRAPSSATNVASNALVTCDVITKAEAEALTGKPLVGSSAVDENGFQGCHWVFDTTATCTQASCMPVDSRWDLDVRAIDHGGRAALESDLVATPACPTGITYGCSSQVADLAPDAWHIGNLLEVVRGDRLFRAYFVSYSASDVAVSASVLRKVFADLGL
jgi:hypothetical protein